MTNETQKNRIEGKLEDHLVSILGGRKSGGAPFIRSPNLIENFAIRGVVESQLGQIKPHIAEYFAGRNLHVGKTQSGDMSIYDGPTERFWLTISEEEDNSYESRTCRERPYEVLITLVAK